VLGATDHCTKGSFSIDHAHPDTIAASTLHFLIGLFWMFPAIEWTAHHMIQTVLVDYIAAGFDNKSTSFSIKNLSALQLTPSLFTFFHFRAWFGSTRKSTHPSSFFCMKRSNLGPVILFTSRTSPGRFTVKCSRPSRSEGPQLSAKLQKKKERDPLRLLSRPMFNGLQMLSSPPSSARQLFSLLASSPARRGWSLPITSGPTRSTPGRYSTPRPSPTPWSTSALSSRVIFAPLCPRHFAFRLGAARTLVINRRREERLKLALENVVSVKLE
jgi:hypothetical protein